MLKFALIFASACFGLRANTVSVATGFFFYSPNSVTVTAGDTIHWTTLNGHDVAETNNTVPGPTVYNGTGFQSPCCSATTFDWIATAGDHYYFCEVHGGSSMFGHIFVQTPTPTPTISDTFTPGPSLTPSVSPTITPTFSDSPTPTPQFLQSPLDKTILGPVPVKAGQPLCLAFSSAPLGTLCELYNSRGELVAKSKFGSQIPQCLSTQNLAPGLYYANIEETDSAGSVKSRLQKIVITP